MSDKKDNDSKSFGKLDLFLTKDDTLAVTYQNNFSRNKSSRQYRRGCARDEKHEDDGTLFSFPQSISQR